MLTGSRSRALLHIAARLSNTSSMTLLPPTTTRSWDTQIWGDGPGSSYPGARDLFSPGSAS